MRSVTRKAAVTAGLGAAIVAGAAAPALAADAGAPAAQAPAMPKVAQENAGNIGPFPVAQLTDQLPTGQVGSLTGGLESVTQQATGALPTDALPGVPGVPGGLAPGGLVPGGLLPGLG